MKNTEDPRSFELIKQHTLQEEQMLLRVYQTLNTIDKTRYTFTDAREIVKRREEFRKALGL